MRAFATSRFFREALLPLMLGLGTWSCGGSTSSNSSAHDGGGGSGGEGGSDRPDTGVLPALGGVRIEITPGMQDPTRACTRVSSSLEARIPKDNPISSTNAGTRLANGVEGAAVACQLSQQSGVYVVDAGIARETISFAIEGALSETGGVANIDINTPEALYLSNRLESPPSPCTFTVNQGKIGDTFFFVDWSCPRMGDPSEPSLLCQATGTVVFENCRD